MGDQRPRDIVRGGDAVVLEKAAVNDAIDLDVVAPVQHSLRRNQRKTRAVGRRGGEAEGARGLVAMRKNFANVVGVAEYWPHVFGAVRAPELGVEGQVRGDNAPAVGDRSA